MYGTKVLLIEDDPAIVENLSAYLREEGFQVTSADGQRAALAQIEAERPRIVLLDVTLKEGNGYSTCTAIKAGYDIPVIFLTALGDEFSVVTGLDKRRALIREAETMLERISWLVAALLKMSKLDAGAVALSPRQVELGPFLREAMEPFEISMEVHGKTFEIRGAEKLSVFADYNWTLEAVRNVLKNGMEYTPEGGRVLVECSDSPIFTQIRITDSGSGIPAEDIPHLFERFYRGKNAGRDSFGIGLALSQMILSRENAVIRAGNSPEGGGEFQIRFYKTVM